MANWKKLRDDDGDEIWVNLSAAIWMQKRGRFTRIAFPGDEDEAIDVAETPEEILGG